MFANSVALTIVQAIVQTTVQTCGGVAIAVGARLSHLQSTAKASQALQRNVPIDE